MTVSTTQTVEAPVLEVTDLTGLFPLCGSEQIVCVTQKQLTLGRDPTETPSVAFGDQKMSRNHARLDRLSSGLYTLRDTESKNGTWHNGNAANGRLADHGDVIRLGDTVLIVAPFHRGDPTNASPIIGRSAAISAVQQQIAQFAKTELTVLISGESGTGKELVAQELHRQSQRKGPLVAVNCAAIPEQLLERELFGHKRGAFTGATGDADGYVDVARDGTLFLDEIGELPSAMQAKLLRFLETRRYSPVGSALDKPAAVRIVAATNRDLSHATVDGSFRLDLFSRLAEALIALPALRTRREDLMLLVDALLTRDKLDPIFFNADAVEALALHSWPGNVRELEKLLRRLHHQRSSPEPIVLRDLPEQMKHPFVLRQWGGGAPGKKLLILLLRKHGGNVSQIADELGKDRKQVYRWLEAQGLDAELFRK